MRQALAILGSILCGLTGLGLFALTLLLMLGHALAEEPFDAEFYSLPIVAMVLLGLSLLIVAFRLGIGRWPTRGPSDAPVSGGGEETE